MSTIPAKVLVVSTRDEVYDALEFSNGVLLVPSLYTPASFVMESREAYEGYNEDIVAMVNTDKTVDVPPEDLIHAIRHTENAFGIREVPVEACDLLATPNGRFKVVSAVGDEYGRYSRREVAHFALRYYQVDLDEFYIAFKARSETLQIVDTLAATPHGLRGNNWRSGSKKKQNSKRQQKVKNSRVSPLGFG